MKHTKTDLLQMQSLPLSAKILMTKQRIKAWYDYWNGQVYVSFSGGKDSTVLLHIARELYPDIEAVFVNTGLEYPEIQKFVKTFYNVTILRPKMRFDEVIKTYGYPIISKEVANNVHYARNGSEWAIKRFQGLNCDGSYSEYKQKNKKYSLLVDVDFYISDRCCSVMKKHPAKQFEKETGKKPILAIMADESALRKAQWLIMGCNAFDIKRPLSKPMSFWTEQDVLQYIKENNIPIASVYGDIDGCGTGKLCTTGCNRTGCIFCAFGAHLEKGESRFERLKRTHPRQYEYCIGGGEYVDGVWKPNKQGLGMGHVFDELNKIYGDGFIKY